LDSCTEYVSYLPYNEISNIQEKAHLLYLPLNNTPNAKGILTGKFFEYLAARRYIIAQGPIDGDIAKILKETEAGEIFDYTNVEELNNVINLHFKNYVKNEYIISSVNIEQYSRSNLTKKLDEIIQHI